jgi:outer membrane receptor protein involved in Fe transport
VVPGLTFKGGVRYTRSRQTMNECNHDSGDGTTAATIELLYPLFNPGQSIEMTNADCITFTTPPTVNVLKQGFIDQQTESNVSWRAGADYKPSRDLLLYVNVAKGYKAGAYATTGALFETSYTPVKQEALLDYEAGFKAQLMDRRLSLNAAVFWYDYSDKQLLSREIDPVVGLIPALVNIPKSRVRGAELEATARPIDGLVITGGVTYLDAKITKYEGVNAAGVLADFAGTRIPFTSKWQYLASVDYTAPTGGSWSPFVGATVSGRSSAVSIVGSGEGTIIHTGFRSSIPIADIYNMPGYALLDLRAGVESADGTWRFTVWGRNVTNTYYVTNVTQPFEAVVRYAGQPQTYGVTFNYKFR